MTNTLSSRLKNFGEELLAKLDETAYRPTSMLWTDDIKRGKWVLVIGTMSARVVEGVSSEEFVKNQNRMIQDIARMIKESSLENPKFDFLVLAPLDNFLLRLGMIVNTTIDDIGHVEIRNFKIDDVDVGSNYIYRLYTKR